MKESLSNLPQWFDSLSEKEREKLLSDKFYLSQALAGHSYDSLVKSGWLNHAYSLKEMEKVYASFYTPFEYYSRKNDELFILVNTGSYAPAHMGHVSMLKRAKEEIVTLGLNPNPIMVLSPSHDKYVLEKSKDITAWNINNRVEALVNIVENYPQKDKDDVFLIDPWEAVYCEHPVNFTDVIIKYIKDLESLNIKFKIGYVFGSDNEDFLYAFSELNDADKDKFYAICVEREGYPFKISSPQKNILYVKNHKEYMSLQSRELRKENQSVSVLSKPSEQGIYAVRDDASLALKTWVDKYPKYESQLKKSFADFHNGLKDVIQKYSGVKTQSIDLEIQKEIVKDVVKEKQCLNLDIGTNDIDKDFALNYGRMFVPASLQKSPIKMVTRPEFDEPISFQLNPGKYVFIDDDIASGTTFKLIRDICLIRNIELVEQINLAEKYCEQIGIEYHLFDIVDTKDFLLGSYTGGLICYVNNKAVRLPYFAKFVNLHTRAKIAYSDIMKFNEEVIKLNLKFFNQNKYLTLNDINVELRRLISDHEESTCPLHLAMKVI